MSFSYTYTILQVDESAKCMSILYSSEGYQDILVSARLPWSDESVEAIVSMYAPIPNWLETQKQLLPVEVNTSGTILVSTASPVPTEEELANGEMWAQIDFEKKVAKCLVKFGVLQTDPTDIEVTQL
jgi:hypothetical protein